MMHAPAEGISLLNLKKLSILKKPLISHCTADEDYCNREKKRKLDEFQRSTELPRNGKISGKCI